MRDDGHKDGKEPAGRAAASAGVRYGSLEPTSKAFDRLMQEHKKERETKGCFASMFVRQVRQCFSVVWADGFPRCRHRFPVM